MGVPWQSLIILGYDFREVVRQEGELFGLDIDAILILSANNHSVRTQGAWRAIGRYGNWG